MPSALARIRTVFVVAHFDFFESIRSRKAVALLAIYLLGATAGTALFTRVLAGVEATVAGELGRPPEGTGALADAVLESESFRQVVVWLVGDEAVAGVVTSMPPLAMFYGWMSLTFVPLFAVLFSCDAISSELASGSVRFALLRVDRLSWAIGKLGAQGLLMAAGLLASAAVVFLLGALWLDRFAAAENGLWLARLATRSWAYGFAYLGLATAVSQIRRTPSGAHALGLVSLAVVSAVGSFLGGEFASERWPGVAPALFELFPAAHALDLWRPDAADRLGAISILLAIGVGYFALGHMFFSRRDA